MVLALALTLVSTSLAQNARFFRIAGPAATSITAFRPDGTLVWTNAQPGTNYTIQTVTSLPGGTNWVDYVRLPATSAASSNRLVAYHPPTGMAFIPAGSFEMGDTNDVYGTAVPVHTVTVSAFYMDRFKVTKALWDDVRAYATNHGYNFDWPGFGTNGNYPVCIINWFDAVKWCNARSEQEGLTPAYYTNVSLTLPYRSGQAMPSVNWTNNGYRLPTEAEWEKAARGGLTGHLFPWGDTIDWSHANYHAELLLPVDVNPTAGFLPGFGPPIDPNQPYIGNPHISPVGYFPPNGYGLYDMSGNVWDRCWDLYAPYTSGPQTDPHGPAYGTVSLNGVIRGGDWSRVWYDCTTSRRWNIFLGTADYIGFRCVRTQ